MAAYVVFDVEVWDFERFAEFQPGIKMHLKRWAPAISQGRESTSCMRVTGSRAGLQSSSSRR
jgi:hypothetical protein